MPSAERPDLRSLLYAPQAWDLLEPLGCGWLDGGCRILADALNEWLGPSAEKMALLDEAGRIQHVLIRIGRVFIDGDGMTLEHEILARWQDLEGIKGPRVAPLDTRHLTDLDAAGIPASQDIEKRLVGILRDWMGGPAFIYAARSI